MASKPLFPERQAVPRCLPAADRGSPPRGNVPLFEREQNSKLVGAAEICYADAFVTQLGRRGDLFLCDELKKLLLIEASHDDRIAATL